MDGVPYTYDNNGNLLNDGVNTYTYDSANRLKSMSGQSTVSSFGYNGLGDRLSQTVNGITTNYTLDLNAGLTQVLNDGTNAYVYGLGRIAQVNTSTEYFLGDALGSVRQLTDVNGDITLAKAYQAYGEVMSSSGSGTSPFAYTGEQQDVSGLTYLRARYYSSNTSRFLTRDTWMGDYNRPLSLNRWNYTKANPINYVDPSGHFSESVIQYSLEGQTLSQTFGPKLSGVPRWGLYALLKDAKSWDQFTLRTADFGYSGNDYPLKMDNDGSWITYEHGCELVFLNPKWGYLSLQDFIRTLDFKASISTVSTLKWWRLPSMEYHWYESNNKYYSDFYEFSDLPELLLISGSLGVEVVSVASIKDKYGNQYYGASVGFPLGVSFAEAWEGYGSFNASERSWRTLNESELKSIILGWSITGNASAISAGAGFSLWRTGTIAFFGGLNASGGASLSVGYTWENPAKDNVHRWDWIDRIPRYGPP